RGSARHPFSAVSTDDSGGQKAATRHAVRPSTNDKKVQLHRTTRIATWGGFSNTHANGVT
ncbi:unnamed protein product, partial [Ectocarpus sp. 6 AP-2014]